jgi:hypothetical protein
VRITKDRIELAYRKLKTYVYYDKTDLRLRARLAAFECGDLEASLAAVADVLGSHEPWSHSKFIEWIGSISHRAVPKKIKWDAADPAGAERGRFISNVTSPPHVEVEKVNFFFDGPIELYLLSVLWIPNLSKARLKPFANLLNMISTHEGHDGKRVDLVVFPEVSVPFQWEPMIVAWARRHRIGVVCGLEHRVRPDGEAWNEVLAALPYQAKNNHWACMPIRRLKRRYSPEETFVLENNRLKVPVPVDPYQLIRWRGASFGIYNCFELASIEDRSCFKSHVDFIVCTEFNRDIQYFSNIVESASRDLHCFVVQVNDSAFGDSRIVCPSRTESMSPVRIKGGDNLTFLTAGLNLKSLRDHQRVGYGLQKESKIFKPTPPGFSRAAVLARIALGK